MKFLSLEQVSLIRNDHKILHEVDWQVQQGEHWVLYGLNGAGKTAILNLINGYHYPSKGKVTVFDKQFGKVDIRKQIRRKIGLVSQSLQERLYNSDSAFEIVLSGAFTSIGLYEMPNEETRKKAIELLESLDALAYADREYSTLSQGEKQRVLIARALMNNPDLLILDEPTNGLDFLAKEYLLDEIEKIAAKPNGPTILYVTHHLDEIMPAFEKVLLLKNGKVFSQGEKFQLLSQEHLSEFFGIPVDVQWSYGRPVLARVKDGVKEK